jgi:hypothetical protein
MKETDSISETLLYLNHLTRLLTGEHFSGFIHRGNSCTQMTGTLKSQG